MRLLCCALFLFSLLLPLTSHAAPAASSIQIDNPKPATLANVVKRIRLVVFVDTDATQDWTITNGDGVTALEQFDGDSLPANHFFGLGAGDSREAFFATASPSPLRRDKIVITGPPAGEQYLRRYTLEILTASDHDNSCNDVMAADESWTIAVGAASKIVGVCTLSYKQSPITATCDGGTTFEILSADADAAREQSETAPLKIAQRCEAQRPDTQVVMVLDRSGSMNWPSLLPSGAPKIDVLRWAMTDYAEAYDDLSGLISAGDQLSVVFFDTAFRLPSAASLPGITNESNLHSATTISTDLKTNITPTQPTANGWTSMGGGLVEAGGRFPGLSGGERRAVVVMSDGMQNRDPMVEIECAAPPCTCASEECFVRQSTGGGAATDITGITSGVRIDAVTVGTMTAVQPEINENLALATGGLYLATDDLPPTAPLSDAALLRIYFLQLLENTLAFNTAQGVRLARGDMTTGAPYTTTFRLSPTGRVATVAAMWETGAAKMTITSPSGVVITETGSQRIVKKIEKHEPGMWKLSVEPVDQQGTQQLDVKVIEEDFTIHTEVGPIAADHKPDDEITLQARVRNGPNAITKLEVALVHVIGPEDALGDALSDFDGKSVNADGDDTLDGTDAYLRGLLESSNDPLRRGKVKVDLKDDGKNGDAAADDGIYTGKIEASVPGHYNFLFELNGKGNTTAHFARESMHSIHVRDYPDPEQSAPVTKPTAKPTVKQVVFTPRSKTGHRFGPGWANYFVATVDGRPRRLNDALDGSYTLELDVTAGNPTVTIEYLDVLRVVTDVHWEREAFGKWPRVPVGQVKWDGNGCDPKTDPCCGSQKGCCCPPDTTPPDPAAGLIFLFGLGVARRRRRL